MNAQQLKNSILQMAVQGKLVPQDPNDEPANVLLERIRKEKEKLIKEGRIKKEKNPSYIFRGEDNLPYEKIGKNEPVCIADEVPFEIPRNWEWVRLGTICTDMLVPQRDKPKSFGGNIPWCRIEDIEGKYLNGTQSNQYVSQTAVETMNLKVNPIGTVISANSASIGAAAICTVRCITNQTFIGLVCSCGLYNEYLYYFLKANVDNLKKLGTGTTISYISQDKYRKFMFPLPPLEEQKRIVARILELEPLIDGYNKTYEHLTKLDTELPVKLKKSILQQAVMGKLVPQDPNDEPASVLLERIRAEKQALIKAGKLKKEKHESIIYRRDNSYYEKQDGVERCIDDEIPFDIPEQWAWCRLGDIGETNIGLTYKPSDIIPSGGIMVLRSSNIKDGKMDYNDCVYVSCFVPDRAMINKGDILICARNGSRALVGKCALVDKDGMAFGAFMAKFNSRFNPYIKLFLESPVFREQLDGVKTETINQITQNNLKSQLIPLPPLNEQKRIVCKISELLRSFECLVNSKL